MAPEFITPLDHATGIPFPLMPRVDLPPVPVGRIKNEARIADWHHPFHPRQELVSEGITSAVAVRNCRIQWAEYDDHHHKYHGAYFGPVLPETDIDRFRTVVFAAAGYVPDAAIAFGRFHRPLIKKLDEDQRNYLWHSGQIRIANFATVRDYLLEYTLASDLSGVRESTIDEFLHTSDVKRRKELGGTLLGIAAYRAAAPVNEVYKLSRKMNLIPPDRARTAGRFILKTMNTQRQKKAMSALMTKLAA
ncbi:MAG TPA: hypothetical protein VFH39_03615 [Candidatus Saccharimonadales bacterium]|nr:hypothetical protein [Candidatus Saccharimonadales bacterium]